MTHGLEIIEMTRSTSVTAAVKAPFGIGKEKLRALRVVAFLGEVMVT